MFVLLGLHVVLVQRHGMSVPPDVEREKGVRGVDLLLSRLPLRDLVGWLSALAILAAMAAFFPAHLGVKADPFASAPAGIRPEWYFMFMFQTLKLLPAQVLGVPGDVLGILAFGALAGVLLLIPFLDRRAAQGEPSRLFTWLAWGALAYILVLTAWGYAASATG